MEASMTTPPTSPNPHVPASLPDDVHYGFTRHGLERMIHHIHPIPLGRGFTAAFMSKNWPGLSLSDAMNAAKAAGVVKRDRRHFAGVGVRAAVKEMHILHDGSLRVVKFTTLEQKALRSSPTRPS
jgi:hypothetical protein